MDGCCDDSGDLARILVRVPEDGGDVDHLRSFKLLAASSVRIWVIAMSLRVA
jgi:hypothetical protein